MVGLKTDKVDVLHACSWDVRLQALQNYYGNPGSVFPFHYLNPGAYISNVTFWVRALDDYKKGEVTHRAHALIAVASCTHSLKDALF